MSGAPHFFILASGRSGSTLLAAMLNMHPRIFVPVELFGLYSDLPAALPWYGDLRREFNRRLLLRDLGRIGQLAEFGVALDEAAFLRGLDAHGCGLAGVVRAFYEALLAGSGKAVLGDKTPNHSPHLRQIERLFPAARIVHLVRDGRDCAASSIRSRRGIHQRNVYELGRLWPRNNAAIADFGARSPERYHRIRYEDLIADVPRHLAALCEFLGESYHPEMVEFGAGSFARENAARLGHHGNLTRDVLRDNRGRWRTELTGAEAAVYESLAGEGLERFGYPLARAPLGARVRLLRFGCWGTTQVRRLRRALGAARVGAVQRAALTAKRLRHAAARGRGAP